MMWLLAGLLVAPAHAADVVECSVQRGSQVQYWAWREVDGRKCWYVGKPGKPKNELYWRGNEATPVHRAESSVPTPTVAPPDTTPPLPSSEELKARAEAALRLLGGERIREEPAKPVVERVPPPPPPKQVRERLPIWAMALLIITCVGTGFLFPLLWRTKHG